MTENDVLAIVGMPPGDYTSDPKKRFFFGAEFDDPSGVALKVSMWRTDWGELSVLYKNGIVEKSEYDPGPTFITRLTAWFQKEP